MTLESNLCQEIIRLQRQCSSVESLHVTARSGSPQISIDSKLEYAYDCHESQLDRISDHFL